MGLGGGEGAVRSPTSRNCGQQLGRGGTWGYHRMVKAERPADVIKVPNQLTLS